jgi:hypothetical protein
VSDYGGHFKLSMAGFPEVDNMSIVDALRRSSNKFSIPDDRTGFGIPDAKNAFVLLIKKLYMQDAALDNSCEAIINWTVKAAEKCRSLWKENYRMMQDIVP